MNFLIPLGGNGIRFKNEDYAKPKALTLIDGDPIIIKVIESLGATDDDSITIVYNYELDYYNFEDVIKKEFDLNIEFIRLPYKTSGPIETVLYGLNNSKIIKKEDPLLIHDGDSFVKNNYFQSFRDRGYCIFYFTSIDKNPIYSYILLDDDCVSQIEEKNKISDNACCGFYLFKSSDGFIKYSNQCDSKLEEVYISDVYKKILQFDKVKYQKINSEDYICLGTPSQLINYSGSLDASKKRFCFDLDNTLVSYPKVKGDYTTVSPISKNINFLKKLKESGHYIIIYTARRMLTHKGNVSKILKDVGRITFDTLDKFDIPFDELCFGKPYADFYIDDKGVDCFGNLEKETGFYSNKCEPRDFNNISYKNDVVIKTGLTIDNEAFFYKNIPDHLKYLFPKFVHYNGSELTIERIKGNTFSSIFTHKDLSVDNLILLLNRIGEIHSYIPQDNSDIYYNYCDKLKGRYESYDYSKFSNSKDFFIDLFNSLYFYKTNGFGSKSMIHGDPVFTNIILCERDLKFIDMRGKLDKKTISGDTMYDYAKVYQSIIGYDFILNDMPISIIYTNKLKKVFEDFYISKFGENSFTYLKIVTASLFFSLIPLHDNEKCFNYYKLAQDLFYGRD